MSFSFQEIKQQLLADRKKLSFMMALCGVALLLWGRLMLKDAPRSAVADPEQTQMVSQGAWSFGSNYANDLPSIVYADVPDKLARDLFQLDASTYQRLPKQQNSSDETASTQTAYVDENQTLRSALAELSLQTTITGQHPQAVINGQLVKPGETMLGFTLRQVEARSVILERDGRLVRLGM